MALDPLEWGVIAVMGIAIFIWGPDKVPEIAKTLGQARRDIDAATKQFQGIAKEFQNAAGTGNLDGLMNVLPGMAGVVTGQQTAATAAPPADAAQSAPNAAAAAVPAAPVEEEVSDDTLLIDMARKLNIFTQGKTKEEIQELIVAKASQSPVESVTASEVQPEGAATAGETSQQAPAAS